MTARDPYDTRTFANGRLYGGKFDEMSGRMRYEDISPFRMAGEGFNYPKDVVIYMGRAAQTGEQDPSMDQAIANGFVEALSNLVLRPGDRSEARTMEYRPERDEYGVETMELRDPSKAPEVAGSPSFDLSYPKIPGRDVEGIPNANDPVMREKLRNRLLKNLGGQDLPGFLKKASADGGLVAQVNPTYPAGDSRYGQPMSVDGKPMSLDGSEYEWTQRMNELRRSNPSDYEKVKSMMQPYGWGQPPAGFTVPAGI